MRVGDVIQQLDVIIELKEEACEMVQPDTVSSEDDVLDFCHDLVPYLLRIARQSAILLPYLVLTSSEGFLHMNSVSSCD